MVPPQSLTLVSSNTSKLLPTCSYSSIQPFSHQVSASLVPCQGRERGACGESLAAGSCWWLVAAAVCWSQAQAVPTAVPHVPGQSRGCPWERCLPSAPRTAWVGVFQSNTKSASCSVTPNQNWKSPLSFLFPWINCSSLHVPQLLCLFPCRTLGLAVVALSHTHKGDFNEVLMRCSNPSQHGQSLRCRITKLHHK